MGLVQSSGPFAGGSWPGAERLMAALESAQLSLMNVDFCCWPLKSVLLWSRDNTEAKRKPTQPASLPLPASQCWFGGLFEMYIMPIWKTLVSGNTVGVCGILTVSHTLVSFSKLLRISRFNVTLSGPFGSVTFALQAALT